MKKIALLAVSAASIAMFSGCAGMFSGETQMLTVKSNPEGANVMVNGMTIGQTPLTAPIVKKKDLLLTLSKDGYKEVTTPLNTSFDPMALVGLFSYGTPITTDIQKGTAYQISPNYYQFDMQKAEK
ncbi:MAG: PEGA domain-containing protein [Sulfuricurvum sp.]|uniref:PEGA domain-containing protein n=1 Tax=Sulfuricurvum sp. TaxID=2025608 RepID=UPI002727EB4F|nr:PEGA domain-containing protein [Sulfuricurvum sp.]MDO9055276.1 PEGA domain-containing protein [Sulfuricurvum sp.]